MRLNPLEKIEKIKISFSLVSLIVVTLCVLLLPCYSSENSPDDLIKPSKTIVLSEKEVEFIESLEPLKVMVDDNFIPLSSYDAKKSSYHGISVDLFRHIAESLKLKYTLLHDAQLSWSDKEDLLKTGKIDMLMPVSFTTQRALSGIFTSSFYDTYYGAIAKSTRIIRIKDSFDMASYRIGVTKASAIISFIQPFVPSSNILAYDTQKAMYQAIRNGEIDIALQNKNVFREDRFNMGFVDLTMFHTVVESPRKYSYYFTKSATHDQLIGIVNRCLAGTDIERLISYYDRGEDELILRYTEQKNQQKILLMGISGLLTLLALLGIAYFNHRRLAVKLSASLARIQLQQAELQKSEYLLKESQRAASVGSYKVDFILDSCETSEVLDQIFGIDQSYHKNVQGWLDLVHPEDKDLVNRFISELAVSKRQTFALEYRIIRKDDAEVRWIYGLGEAIFDVDGNLAALIGTVQDITAQRHLEDQLRQAQKMEAIGTLAGGIAHDFNNILGAIIGYAEMIREDCPPGSAFADDINQVLIASDRAKELVKQILAFSRQAKTNKIPLRPAVLVKESIKLLRSSIPTTIDIQQDIDPGANLVLADPTQIHQIIMNLCTNAYHAMEDTGGTLSLSLKNKVLCEQDLVSIPSVQPGHFVQLSIRDTGCGIAPEIMDRIFDPYFTTKETGKGTGMGLAIAHGIAKSYGGFIACHSEIGVGTVLEINLPALLEQIVPETEKVALTPVGTEHILFIDDEEMLVKMGQAMLEKLGYAVTAQMSSIEALAAFKNQPDAFDLVITDQTMPGITGFDMARRMLQIRPDLPIILCTGYSSQVSEEKARAYGIKGFALKPLAQKDIAALIRKIIDKK